MSNILELVTPLILRTFWKRVRKDENGCWLWTRALDKDGYGKFTFKDRVSITSHRFSMIIHLNEELDQSELVLHSCDVRRCVNPYHLFIGDRIINRSDCIRKGRQAKGEDCARSKLTRQRVLFMRSLYQRDYKTWNPHRLGRIFGVKHGTAKAAILGLTWSHLP